MRLEVILMAPEAILFKFRHEIKMKDQIITLCACKHKYDLKWKMGFLKALVLIGYIK